MAEILNDIVSEEYLKEFETKYNEEKKFGTLKNDTIFQYCWCLVRSKNNSDIRRGVHLLEELLSSNSERDLKKDYLYTVAIGYARLKEYTTSIKYVKDLLQIEAGNRQAQDLEKAVRKSMESDAIKGAAIAGGGILAVGAIVALGFAFLKK